MLAITAGYAQKQTEQPRKGHGASTDQEIGQAVFNALQQNQFSTLDNYLPDEAELRTLKRKSSEDMRQLMLHTTPDSIRYNLQRQFSIMMDQASEAMLNWNGVNVSGIKATRRDTKNPFLYQVQLTIANPAGSEKQILFEAIRIRSRYFLFKQMGFKPEI